MTGRQERVIEQLVSLAEELAKDTPIKGLGIFSCNNCGKITIIDNQKGCHKSKFCSIECKNKYMAMHNFYKGINKMYAIYETNTDYFDEDLTRIIKRLSKYRED